MSRSQDFLRGTAADQSRKLATTGVAAIAVLGVAAVGVAMLYPKMTAPKGIEVAVDVAYVGPGVAEGTKVVLHGRSVGRVTALERTESESVQMQLTLDEDQISGLTDEFQLDFRPENYFGTSAVNIVARPGGTPLESGMHLLREPEGDFTMSTMIEQGSLTIDGTLTDNMITALDKTVHYLDGVTGWIDTGLLVADRVAETQLELPTTQIAYFNDILDEMPGFSEQTIESLMNIYDSNYNRLADGSIGVDDAVFEEADAGLTLAANQLFGQAGALLASHGDEVTPLVTSVAVASDVFPHLVNGGMTPEAGRNIVRRLDSAFVDTADGQRLRLRVLVDVLPAFTSPLGLGASSAQEGSGR